MYKKKRKEKMSIRSKQINMLLDILFEKSDFEKNHSQRVAKYSERLAKALNLSVQEIELTYHAG